MSREPVLKRTCLVGDTTFGVWRSPGRFTKHPDLVRVASGRTLFTCSGTDGHFSKESQLLTLLASDDGSTWHKALLSPKDGDLSCVMRDNTNNGYSSQVAFSEASRRNWSAPQDVPWTDPRDASWVELPDGHIFLVDYTNYGDAPDTSQLVDVYMGPHDIA